MKTFSHWNNQHMWARLLWSYAWGSFAVLSSKVTRRVQARHCCCRGDQCRTSSYAILPACRHASDRKLNPRNHETTLSRTPWIIACFGELREMGAEAVGDLAFARGHFITEAIIRFPPRFH